MTLLLGVVIENLDLVASGGSFGSCERAGILFREVVLEKSVDIAEL